MRVISTSDEREWELFLQSQPWSPFLQSFPMGEVYREIGEEPVRLAVSDAGKLLGICQSIVVPARRGRHLAVMYGPVVRAEGDKREALSVIVEELKRIAREKECVFIRMSPFWPLHSAALSSTEPRALARGEWRGGAASVEESILGNPIFRSAPLHLLAEHIWFLNLQGRTEEDLRKNMRPTTRNLIGRAEREGVTITTSDDPVRDLPLFLTLHDETRKRHGFTPYTDDFFRAQVRVFAPRKQCALYLARYNGEVVSASIHMLYGGETSYHHGASTGKYAKIPASYLLQWRAMCDALRRGDRVYNFWGVSPEGVRKHPFAGVRTFKTGFGGESLELMHCMDLPLSQKYWITFAIETVRKWRRGF